MFVAYGRPNPSLSAHHATPKERAVAARCKSRYAAEQVVRAYTNIRKRDAGVYEYAVGCVQEYAEDYERGIGYDYVCDGLTVAEQLAQLAVETVNEMLFEAMVS